MQSLGSENRSHTLTPFGHRGVMVPKEHGAYAEILFPLVTALALGNGNTSSFLLAAAATAVFLSHESLLVLLGERGNRARIQLKARAIKTVVLLLAAAISAGTLGLWHASMEVLQSALVPLFATALLVPLIFSRREKTLLGEFLVAFISSSALVPVALAGHTGFAAAIMASGAWFGIFALQLLTVRAVKAHIKPARGTSYPALVLIALSLAVLVVALIMAGIERVSHIPLAAICPAALVGLACILLRVHPRHLRILGWILVASDLAALAWLTVSLR